MKGVYVFTFFALCVLLFSWTTHGMADPVSEMLEQVEWLKSAHQYGGACIRINASKVIYFDPAHLSEEQMTKKADVILITHPHGDHLHVPTLKQLVKETTQIITVQESKKMIDMLSDLPTIVIASGEELQIDGLHIKAIPAYNTASTAHPKEKGWVGYVITIDGVRVYHSGDTSYIPEMNALQNIDIACMTLRQQYMMDAKEMIEAVKAFRPTMLIPIHWLENTEKNELEYLQKHIPETTRLVIKQPQ